MKPYQHDRQPDILTREQKDKIAVTTLVVPQNDGESMMIGRIADAFGFDVRRMPGTWEETRVEEAREAFLHGLKKLRENVVVVELPATGVEREWVSGGKTCTAIDHHTYLDLDLDRTDDKDRCSLEIFLDRFGISNEQLDRAGLNARFVRGVAANDRGFFKGMIAAGYSIEEIKSIRAFDRSAQYGEKSAEIERVNQDAYEHREQVAEDAWILPFQKDAIYTLALDLVIIDRLRETDGKVELLPYSVLMTRPNRESKEKIRAVFQGFGEKAIERVKKLNLIATSDQIQGAHRWCADVDAKKLERVHEVMRS